MNIANMVGQAIDLEMARTSLDNVVEDIEHLKVKLAEMLDDADPELRDGSRFRRLVTVKALITAAGINAYSARRNVTSALAFQQAALPTPGDIA